MKKKIMVYPIVIGTRFGLSVQDEEDIKKQDWFVSFGDYFGYYAIWVNCDLYFKAFNYLSDVKRFDILCV